MKNKIKNYMTSTMTWGGYWKFTVIACLIGMIITVGEILCVFGDVISWPWEKKKVKSVEDDEE